MDFITSIIHIIGNVPAVTWASLFAIVGVSAFQQKLKHWLVIENPKVLVFMTTVFALAGAAIPAMLGYISASPGNLAGSTALWFTGLTLAYRYVIQPGSVALSSWKNDMADYKTFKAKQDTTLAPTTTVPDIGTSAQLDAIASEVTPAPTVPPTSVTAGVSSEFQG